MEHSFDGFNLALYIYKKVQVKFDHGEVRSGTLSGLNLDQGQFQLDDKAYPLSSIRDIAYLAVVDDFHGEKGYGEMGKIRFTVDDLGPDFRLTDLLYGEYVCTVSCHLYVKNGKISAKDLALVSKRHKLNFDCARTQTLIFRFDDGRVELGTVRGDASCGELLTQAGETVPLDLERVEDITKAPEENDNISLTLASDGSRHSGLVSAVNGSMVILVSENGGVAQIDLKKAEKIRHYGTLRIRRGAVDGNRERDVVISAGAPGDDGDFPCLPQSCRNPDEMRRMQDGDQVSFEIGINDRSLIAKDVALEQAAARDEKAAPLGEYFGIILNLDFSKENGVGYIGNRYVSKACGKLAPGNARFFRSQMDFAMEYNKAYVVKYTASAAPDSRLRTVEQLTLHQVLDFTRCGSLEVTDSGEVTVTPLYQEGITYFENRDVDVQCRDGRLLSGRLCGHDRDGMTIVAGQNAPESGTYVPFCDIADVRIIGTVTQYYSNGTGYVDNAFFFHINEMEQSVDAQYVHRGARLSFALRNARKGNHIDCGFIRVLPEERVDVYVLDYHDQCYRVVDAEKYGKDVHFFDEAYEIPYSSYNQFRDLDNEDYHAILTLQRRYGVQECVSIRTLDGRAKLRAGVVTGMDKTARTVTIMSLADYGQNSNTRTYPLSAQGESERITRPEEKDYEVLYATQMQEGVRTATIAWVDLKHIHDKRYIGYLESYRDGEEYGFLTPEEYLHVKARPKNYGVYFRPGALVDPPDLSELANGKTIFKVCYTLDNNRPRPSAKNIWVLGKTERKKAEAPSPQAAAVKPAGGAAPAPAPVEIRDIELKGRFPEGDLDGMQWEYGIISAYSPVFDCIRIYRNYQNKKKEGASADFEQELIRSLPVPEGGISFDLGDVLKLNTSKCIYLVRIALWTDEQGELQYDHRYPVVVLKEYRRNNVKAMEIRDGVLHLELGGANVAPTPPAPPVFSGPVPASTTAYGVGESVLVRSGDQEYLFGSIRSVEGEQITFEDGRTVCAPESAVTRFGVLTSFNDNLTVGCLNGTSYFSFANMEAKTFNIVKNAKQKMLLCYTCSQGAVTHVERITNDLLDKIPARWQLGKVSGYHASPEERCIVVNDTIRYFPTVATGGYIWTLIKSGEIEGAVVFVKTVTCPADTVDGGMGEYALDIHSEQEKSTIRYDAVTDRFLAARNAASAVPVEGSHTLLSSLVDTETDVFFRISEDGRSLQAFLDGEDTAGEWTEEPMEDEDLAASQTLFRSSLVQFFMGKMDLRGMKIPAGIQLTQEGWPVDSRQTAELAVYLMKRRFFDINEAMAAVALLERLSEEERENAFAAVGPNGAKSVEGLLWKVLNRQVGVIGRSVNCVWGEYSYYENTILCDIHSLERQKVELYKYFLPDFYSRIEVIDYLRQLKSRDHRRIRVDLPGLFRRSLLADHAGQLVAHMVCLDEATIQHLVITENVLEGNDALVEKIVDWGKKIDKTQNFDSVTVLIDHLRAVYRGDKNRLTRELENAARSPSKLTALERVLEIIMGRFVHLITEDDAQRFTDLHQVCREILEHRHAGFTQYRAALANGWAKINELFQLAQQHPTQETTEMLVHTGVFQVVREEISGLLDELLSRPEYLPDIRCASNVPEVAETQKSIMLLVANGDEGHTNRQSAFHVKLMLEVISGLARDSIPDEIVLPEKELLPGRPDTILDGIPISLSALEGDSFSISVSAEYECCVGFENGEKKETRTVDCGILEFQIQRGEAIAKNKNAVNYYLHPSEGKPLEENDAADNSMFFGRQEEMGEIWDAIVDENLRLREGRAVMLYGQKKCGKTSLANQILGRIKNTPQVNQQAIIIKIKDVLEVNGGVTGLSNFSPNFYQYILSAFRIELLLHHKDVKQMLQDNGLEIPRVSDSPLSASLFQSFFLEFAALDQGRHRIILVMDEFTRLCTTLIDHPEYQQIPNFIKLFSGMGFIQIIIGHPNMMKALSVLGIINHTAEFAKRIELSGLKHDEAVQLIREPMIRSFGYDVYDSKLGKRAIEMLLELSGCHPSVLMKLCNEMFIHFISTDYPRIIHYDVRKMLSKYLAVLDTATTFDIMVIEDGDTATFFENLPTYRYLKFVALQSLHSNNRDCDINMVCPELGEEQSREIRETLIMRKVLTASNGRIKICTELFLEYVRYKYESR